MVIDLQNMKTADGKTIDPTCIYLAGFSSDGSSGMYISKVFLSNDGETDATGVEGVECPLIIFMFYNMFCVFYLEEKKNILNFATHCEKTRLVCKEWQKGMKNSVKAI